MEITNNTIPEFDFDIIVDDTPADVSIVDDSTNDQHSIEVDQNELNTAEEPIIEEKDYGDTGDSTAIAFFNELKERGIITEDTDFNGSWDSLDGYIDSIPQKAINQIVAEAPDLTKQILRFAFAGEEVTKDSLSNFMKTYLEEITEVVPEAIETMDDARSFLESIYKERGMRASIIQATLNTLEDEDVLLEEAQSEQTKTITAKDNKKSEALISEAENSKIAKEAKQREFVSRISTEIEQTGWKDNRLQKVKNTLAGNNMNLLLNEVASNPKTLVQLADFLSYYSPKEKTIDYSAFMKQSETAAAKTLQDRVERAINSPTISTKSVSTKPNKSLDNLVAMI